jgi:hypothetical protein
MQFDDIDLNDPELSERLSSWRRLPDVLDKPLATGKEAGVNEREVRLRQHRAGAMCLNLVTTHDAFYAQLEAIVQQEERSPDHQSRVADMASFALGVFEQFSAENLHNGLRNELAGLPKEIIETVTVPAPPLPKSWWQRLRGS